MTDRVVLIGLDGGTFSTLDALMEEGVMPFLKEFLASGVRGELLSVIPPLTPPGWASLVTGRTPGNHGVMDFFRFESPDSRYIRLVDSRDVKCETIWSIISRQGLRATVLNFPLMTPPRPIVGQCRPRLGAVEISPPSVFSSGTLRQDKDRSGLQCARTGDGSST